MLSLAEQEIFDRYKHPRFAGEISAADILASGSNQSCGDEVSFTVRLEGETITKICHKTVGCAICTASADMLAEHLEGKPRSDILQINSDQVTEWIGIPLSPVRLKCALLPLEALKQAVQA